MRVRIIYSPTSGKKMAEYRNGELVWASDEFYTPVQTHMVMGDIQPYQSMVDGSLIPSRSVHRAHLKQHGMIEVGNETKALMKNVGPLKSPPGLKEELIHNANRFLRG